MDDTSSGPALAIYTVPAGRAFLPALAGAILAGDLPRPGGRVPGPLDLADLRILLPTRRAARMLQRAFLEASGAKALLTPRIRPIAPEEDDLGLLPTRHGQPAPSGPRPERLVPAPGQRPLEQPPDPVIVLDNDHRSTFGRGSHIPEGRTPQLRTS